MKNQFEEHIKESLDRYEGNYNPAHWADMEKRLDKIQAGKSSSAGKILGIAAGIAAVAGLIYFVSTRQPETAKVPQVNPPAPTSVSSGDKNTLPYNTVNVNPDQSAPAASPSTRRAQEASPSNNQAAENKLADKNSTESGKTSQEKNASPAGNPVESKAAETPVQHPSPETQLAPSSAVVNAAFHATQPAICAGNAVEFSADNADASVTSHWDFGDGKTSGETKPSHTYQKPGTYTVKLRLVSSKTRGSDEQKNTIVVNPAPSIEMNATGLETYNPSLINFEAKDGNVKEWLWNFDDGQTSREQNPVHQYAKKGDYNVKVTATNIFGCKSESVRMVSITDVFPLAMSGFTPNGDGNNDTWMPASFANGDYAFTLTVYDQNNNIVYQTSDKNQPWTGANTKVGEQYSWKAEVKEKNGKVSAYSGVIFIAK